MKNLLITWLDVINEIEFYFDFDTFTFKGGISKAKILRAIELEQNNIMSLLRPFYSSLLVSSNNIYNINCENNETNVTDFIFDVSKITVNSKFTQVYKVVFSSSTAFTITPDIGAPVAGTVSTDITVGQLTIDHTIWEGYTFSTGDKFLLSVDSCEPTIRNLISKATAAKLLETTFSSESSGASVDAKEYRSQVNRFIKELTDEKSGVQLTISKTVREAGPVAIDYSIDKLGNDVSNYSDV